MFFYFFYIFSFIYFGPIHPLWLQLWNLHFNKTAGLSRSAVLTVTDVSSSTTKQQHQIWKFLTGMEKGSRKQKWWNIKHKWMDINWMYR